ncbi:hypothetical protein BBOV_I002520 [Babesia bovis T2Bo]|uniref:Uncharacterized protein n=1 Tax=Babesia bovis TaxID=5865 RepID=A7AWA6_BABBO|nr:hypothetical protein BBOV_I002520 [Babesia bovis T2Bo]EDO05334.1 hypothetical protein BBOV_I002520 [Babesia bovis T2Bo]|eukprot:XP_001608902.1 hypothetical protein [Babesia bovis T2Bo]
MSNTDDLATRLIELRDHLKSIANTYSTLCVYLRGIDSLSEFVTSDYYEVESASGEMVKRLHEWRSVEHRVFDALKHHMNRKFQSYKCAESAFMSALEASRSNTPPKRDCGIRLKVHRFKQGVIAMKFANEARRRVTNIADFIVEVKRQTGHAPDDYVDNLVILHSLAGWAKAVINDCVRCTSSSADKFKHEESNGQILYTTDAIRRILKFCANNTVERKPDVDKLSLMVKDMLMQSTILISPAAQEDKRNMPTSHITYYLFNVLNDINTIDSDGKNLEPLHRVYNSITPRLKLPTPMHVYQHQEYFCNLSKSITFVTRIHALQQQVLRTVCASWANELLGHILAILDRNNKDTLDLSSILMAIRACHYICNPGRKRLLGIWDHPPFDK